MALKGNMILTPSHVRIPLKEVTVCAQTRKAFDFLNQDRTCTSLLLSTLQNQLVLTQGESFTVPLNLSEFEKIEHYEENIFNELDIVQCKPVYSGLLSLKTEIVVVTNCDRFSQKSRAVVTEHNPTVPVLSEFLLNGTGCNTQSSLGSILNNIVLSPNVPKFRCANIKLFLNFNRFQEKLFSSNAESARHLDIFHTVLLAESYVNKYNLYDGDWIEIKLHPEQKLPNADRKTHLCQVKVLKDQTDCFDGNIYQGFYALPKLFYSLKIQDLRMLEAGIGIMYKRLQCGIDHASPVTSVSSGGPPPFVKELHISCVQSPTYSPGDSYKQLLQNYFAIPRIVSAGDVFAVDTKDDPEYWQNISELSEQRKPILYFKVTNVQPRINGCKVYMASLRETTLYLDGTLQSFVPSMMSYSFRSSHDHNSICPPGLKDIVDHLMTILSPVLEKRLSSGSVAPSVLLSGPAGSGKSSVVTAAAAYLNMHCYQVNCHELCGETSGATEARIKHTLQRAQSYAPCLLLLSHVDALGKDRDGSGDDPRVVSSFIDQISSCGGQSGHLPVCVVATTTSVKSLSADMQEGFLHHLELSAPTESARTEMLQVLFSGLDLEADVSLKHVAQRTAGMVLGDIQALVSLVKKTALKRISNYCKEALGRSVLSVAEEESISTAGFPLTCEDLNSALDQLQAIHSDSLGAPKIPDVKWEDIGGLASVKSDILDTIQLPLQHPELFASGLRRSGVLLYGPPGTGKTLLAKAVATECSLNFLNVKGPELINMYVGQSEENIREVFHRARNASPCVIFFDELDSLAPNRGRSGDSGGVMDRVVSQLLAELDGLHKASEVFVIGATNRPDLLDPALLRPGRFDKLLYLGVSEDRTSQLKILEALTRKFSLERHLELGNIVEMMPFNMTGADIYALCSDAMLNALKRKIDSLDQGLEVDQSTVEVTEDDFRKAVENAVPSVSVDELRRYKSLQAQFTATSKTAV